MIGGYKHYGLLLMNLQIYHCALQSQLFEFNRAILTHHLLFSNRNQSLYRNHHIIQMQKDLLKDKEGSFDSDIFYILNKYI